MPYTKLLMRTGILSFRALAADLRRCHSGWQTGRWMTEQAIGRKIVAMVAEHAETESK
jgi:hypothetical protein